MKLKDSVTSMM